PPMAVPSGRTTCVIGRRRARRVPAAGPACNGRMRRVPRAAVAQTARSPTGDEDMAAQALAGRTAIVPGASSGIGRAAALRFAREGARLVVGARRAEALAHLVDEIERAGGEAVACAGDVRDESHND